MTISDRMAEGPSGPRVSRTLLWLLLGGLPLAAATVASSRAAFLILAASAGMAAFAALLVFTPQRTADVLFLGFVGLVSIPLGKFFLYRPHVGGWPCLLYTSPSPRD